MLKLAPIAASLLLAACGGLSRHMDEPKDPERSLVYGFVDMSDGPCPLDWFSMKQVKPKVEEPYYSFRTCDGAFYAEYIPLGSFQLSKFGGAKTLGNTFYSFVFPQQLPGLRIEKPGLYYVGTFKMKDLGNFFKSKYDIDLAEKPTEREILEIMLPRAKGTAWDAKIRSTHE